jgi:hypothetical protein
MVSITHGGLSNVLKCVGPREGPKSGDKRERNILPVIESRFFSFPASSVVTILTELRLYHACSCGKIILCSGYAPNINS